MAFSGVNLKNNAFFARHESFVPYVLNKNKQSSAEYRIFAPCNKVAVLNG